MSSNRTDSTEAANPRDRGDEQLVHELGSGDENTRAAAAVELVRRGHPHALEACLMTINDAAEFTHTYSTPSMWRLVGFGVSALTPLLELLASADAMTRLRAAHAVMEISKRQFGFDGHEWPLYAYDRWARWWTDIGYAYDAPAPSREAALQRLRSACSPWIPPVSA